MSFYGLGDSFRWFLARVVDIKDPEFLGRVKIRTIHDQTGELGEKKDNFGLDEEDLLWAWPLSAINSASLSWKKVVELEEFDVPDWIDAVGLSPTGTAVGTYVFGFYLDGLEANIPMIFSSYHKLSVFPEPGKDPLTMLQDKEKEEDFQYHDVAALARGKFNDPLGRPSDGEIEGLGQTLPKEPYLINKLWTEDPKKRAPVDEFPTAYATEYPYNTTYTTKSGHAIELDDTPGNERVHIWHRSGCYEEISNGPTPLIDDETKEENIYPERGPKGYTYITAGGLQENEYKGRRNRKTMDTFFDVVGKDHNQMIKRDHNVEVANTETGKIGSTYHWTVGYQKTTKNRVNDNLKTPYDGGGIGTGNYFLDVKNIRQETVANNYVLSVGIDPDNERRLSSDQKDSMFLDVLNDKVTVIGNNDFTEVKGNVSTVIGENFKLEIEQDGNIIVSGEANLTVEGGIKVKGGTTFYGSVHVEGSLTAKNGASGSFSTPSGTIVTVSSGIITSIL